MYLNKEKPKKSMKRKNLHEMLVLDFGLIKRLCSYITNLHVSDPSQPEDGERTEVPEHLLRQVQQARQVQGDPVQEVCRVQAGPGQEEVGWSNTSFFLKQILIKYCYFI